jgi:hypothetical protein
MTPDQTNLFNEKTAIEALLAEATGAQLELLQRQHSERLAHLGERLTGVELPVAAPEPEPVPVPVSDPPPKPKK